MEKKSKWRRQHAANHPFPYDDNSRARDAAYADMQRKQINDALADLQALENGYDPGEVELGDHQATRIPLSGCLFTIGAIALALYLTFSNGFFMGGD